MSNNASYFNPWEGKKYPDGLRYGLKTLIVGESHYDSKESEELTKEAIKSHLAGGNYRFYSTVEKIALGLHQQIAPEEFWDHVAFCNFVQRSMTTIKDRPTEEDCETAWPALVETINKLKPDVMLVMSRLVWDYSPYELDGGHDGRSRRLTPDGGDLYLYDRASENPLLAGYFRHPSRLGAPVGVWQTWAEHIWKTARNELPTKVKS